MTQRMSDGLPGNRGDISYPLSERSQRVLGLLTHGKKSILTAPVPSRCWNIGLDTSAHTMNMIMQAEIRNAMAPSKWNLCHQLDHMYFPNKWYSDTFFSQVKSIKAHKAGQMFIHGKGVDIPFTLDWKGKAHEAIMSFIHEVRIPGMVVTDNAKEETLGEWESVCQKY